MAACGSFGSVDAGAAAAAEEDVPEYELDWNNSCSIQKNNGEKKPAYILLPRETCSRQQLASLQRLDA